VAHQLLLPRRGSGDGGRAPHRRYVVSYTLTLPSTLEGPPRREDRGEPGDRVATGLDGERAIAGADNVTGYLERQCGGTSSCSPRAHVVHDADNGI
jgi:hypothetical protein